MNAAEHDVVDRLIARCRKKPVAALVDEAHTLDLDAGQLLLNASQDVRAQAPFLLVMAGTPGLLAHLGKTNASFWDRLGSGLLGIDEAGETGYDVEPLDERARAGRRRMIHAPFRAASDRRKSI